MTETEKVGSTLEDKLRAAFKGRPYKFSHLGPPTWVGTRHVYFACPACQLCSFLLVDEERTASEVDDALTEHGKLHDSC